MAADLTSVMLAVIIGLLAAIVYTLRAVVLVDKKLTLLCEKMGVNTRDIDKDVRDRPFSGRK